MWDDSEMDPWTDDEDWSESQEESVSMFCPECGGEVYEDADLCPHCGYFLEALPTHPMLGKPAWFVIVGFLGVVATILALSGLF
jgi:hypothetical protein